MNTNKHNGFSYCHVTLALLYIAWAASCQREPQAPGIQPTMQPATHLNRPRPTPTAIPEGLELGPSSTVVLKGSRSCRVPKDARGESKLTVESVMITARPRDLAIMVTVAEDAMALLRAHRRLPPVATVYIDADDDPVTGGGSWTNALARGYEYQLELRPGAIFRLSDGQTEVGIDAYPSDGEVIGGVIEVNISRQRQGQAVERIHGGLVVGGLSDDLRDNTLIDGRVLSVTVPYGKVELPRGRLVRITARRLTGAGGLGDMFFPEALLEVPK